MVKLHLKNHPEPALIDDDLEEDLTRWSWRAQLQNGRVVGVTRSSRRNGKSFTQTLTQAVMGRRAGRGKVWSHLNEDPLDNRRTNLVARQRGKHLSEQAREPGRLASRERMADPQRNPMTRTSKHMRGVTSRAGRFIAQIIEPGRKNTFLGSFETEVEAARAYDAARIARGRAPVNFPDEHPRNP